MSRNNKGLTPQEKTFVDTFAATGDKGLAGKVAGYAQPHVGAHKALARPIVQAEIVRVQNERLFSELLPLAIETLKNVMTDARAPAASKVRASEVVLNRTLGTDAAQKKELHEMTAEEIQAQIDALKRKAADAAKPILEGKAVPLDSVFD